jgi:protein-tyrosine phosphatase
MKRILFICAGNICRSPIVEAVARIEFARAGVAAHFESAGIEDYHIGKPADPRAIRIAEAHGYPLAAHRARQVRRGDFDAFDHLLAMDRANLRGLERLQPVQARVVPTLFLSEAGLGNAEVPDPYFGTEADFEHVVALARSGIDALLERWSTQLEKDGDGHAHTGT